MKLSIPHKNFGLIVFEIKDLRAERVFLEGRIPAFDAEMAFRKNENSKRVG